MALRQNPANSSSSFQQSQFRWKTDPTFYPTARLAMESPGERYAYVAALAPSNNGDVVAFKMGRRQGARRAHI
jgi:hypothetical protein